MTGIDAGMLDHLFVTDRAKKNRDQVYQALKQQGIQTKRWA